MQYLSDIARHSYSPGELRRCVQVEDAWNYNLFEDHLETATKSASNSFFSSNCAVQEIDQSNLKSSAVFTPGTYYDQICLRRTDQIVKAALRLPPINRHDEVKQLLEVLRTEQNFKIFRTDIKSFFETIPLGQVISNLESDGFRNSCALLHLKSLARHLDKNYMYTGLPRGLSISSTLADYSMHSFDREVLSHENILYYTRYVDDICIVHFDNQEILKKQIEEYLPFGKLTLNQKKTHHADSDKKESFEFLGYEISLCSPLKIKVASGKLAKTKKRIILSFKRFLKDSSFNDLYSRIRYLSCTTQMQKARRKTPVWTGYRHVYQHCSEEKLVEQLDELDHFYFGILSSRRFSLSRNIRSILTGAQILALSGLSFRKGYTKKISQTLNPKEVAKIVAAWKYE